MTLLELVTRALFDLKVLQSGEVPDAADAELARVTINDWIDGLSTEGLTIYTITRATWTLVSGTASYTIGNGATINVDRPNGPADVENIGYINTALTPNMETLLGPVLTEDQYAAIPAKTLQTVFPAAFYYNPTFGVTGFGTLRPFPIPTSSVLTGVIYVPTAVDEFAAITDTVSQPPGYRRFFRTNLAVELATAFDAEVTAELKAAAVESKRNIKVANIRLADLSCGDAGDLFGGSGPSNIYTGF